jgi:hypothetical protein
MSSESLDHACGHALLGTESANDEPSRTFQERRSRCFELAAYALGFGDAPHNAMLVHGSVFNPKHSKLGRISHAWLSLPGGLVWEPVTTLLYTTQAWGSWANPESEFVYTRRETQRMIMVHMHYGPWERMKHQ